jgi:hypothetical protein
MILHKTGAKADIDFKAIRDMSTVIESNLVKPT